MRKLFWNCWRSISAAQESDPDQMIKPELKTCNLDYLFELAKGDMGFVKEMIEVFLSENGEELDNLEKAIKLKDYPAIGHISHKLRSSIPYVGLDLIIGDEMMKIEHLAKNEDDIEEIQTHFDKVSETSRNAIEELKGLKL
jgi:HPt (histidine-containing phosphotransfer) domain-containing protein